jgi:hypothetical protein
VPRSPPTPSVKASTRRRPPLAGSGFRSSEAPALMTPLEPRGSKWSKRETLDAPSVRRGGAPQRTIRAEGPVSAWADSRGELPLAIANSPVRDFTPALVTTTADSRWARAVRSESRTQPREKGRSRPVSRVLSRRKTGGGEHSSRTRVAARLQRAVPGGWGGPPDTRLAARRLPICSCTRWGLPCRLRHRRRGALLPHRFTLATRASRRRSAVCSLWHFPAGHPDRPLAGTLPCGARTFLGGPCPADRRIRPDGSGGIDLARAFWPRKRGVRPGQGEGGNVPCAAASSASSTGSMTSTSAATSSSVASG